MHALDAYKQKGYILDCGKDGEQVIERMVAATECRSIGEVSGSFVLAINATKLSSVTEASAGCMAINGVQYFNDLIDIKGITKEGVCQILDRKLDTYSNLLAAAEVAIMTVQCTPAGVSPIEIVAAYSQSKNESNKFIKDMERSALSAIQLS
eukprot:1789424-Ditylum_brightwellii.AAC.1